MRDKHRARLLIADDHKLIAEACKKLLEPEFDVVGMVTDGLALMQTVAELWPEVVILDVFMPRLNGLDAGEQIKQADWTMKLVYLTMDPSPELAVEAFRRGASGYVLKNDEADELIVAVRRVLRGECYLSPLITEDAIEFILRAKTTSIGDEQRITVRQKEILQLQAEGRGLKEIGDILGLQPGTIAFHKSRLMKVLGINTNSGLVQYAISHHMISK
jgi:DNA-binding NarL/FixJ family response regulator